MLLKQQAFKKMFWGAEKLNIECGVSKSVFKCKRFNTRWFFEIFYDQGSVNESEIQMTLVK